MDGSTSFRCLTVIVVRLALTAGLVTLVSCSTTPTTRSIDTAPLETRAAEAREAGDAATAAALYRQLAGTSRGSQRADYLLEAARLWISTAAFSQAEPALADAQADASPTQRRAIEVLSARVDAGLGRPEAALARLDALGAVGDPLLDNIAAEARGIALFALDRTAEAVRVLVDREIWLDSSAEVLANQRLIWDGLGASRNVPPGDADEIVAGWLALAPVARLEDQPDAFRRALIDWRTQFATHPAAGGILAEIIAAQRGNVSFPQRIALLLPLGSALRGQAEAVRDGFLAARIGDAGAAATKVTVYDTGTDGPVAAYNAAQADGADFIVGPLLPDDVDRVVPLAGFVPTLALNFSRAENVVFPSSLYQYALSPDDEAKEIAERAIASGQLTAVALFASNDRGYRLMASFRSAYEALGGEILAAAAYVPESQSAADQIAEVLNIARSEQRFRRLRANLGQPVEFESRRRRDVDMIFLQAPANIGRLLAPQLKFYRADDIPTYATSDIHDTARTGGESDLDGVIFPDLPVLLEPSPESADFVASLRSLWPQRARQWIRFYSFGFDAYRLIRPIFDRSGGSIWPVAGITGTLDLAADGRIHRRLPFAQFEDGVPAALAPPPGANPAGPPVDSYRGLIGSR